MNEDESMNVLENLFEMEHVDYETNTGNKVLRSAALFLLSMKEKHRLTQTCVDYTVSNVQQMVQFIVEDLHSAIESKIEQQLAGTDISMPDISSCFKDIDPFQGLETEHKQIRFWKNNFGLVVSRLISKQNCFGWLGQPEEIPCFR